MDNVNDFTEMEKDLREKEMRVNEKLEEQQGRERKGRCRRNRRRKEPSNFAREQDFEDTSHYNAWSKYYSQGDTDSTWRAPVKWRLGVKRAVKERLGMRREEAVEDLDLVEYEERIISELQVMKSTHFSFRARLKNLKSEIRSTRTHFIQGVFLTGAPLKITSFFW